MIDDLAGLLKGELRIDPLTRAMYATDASLYQMLPYGVLIPKDRDDVLTVVKYCDEMKIPLVPRGAGTGVAGSAIGSGLVIDFSRSMREIVSIGEETVTVQPGVVYERLNQRLREEGRYFPPDPSGNWTTTLGSMLAVDGAGSHSGRVGSTRDHVLTLDLVMANGNYLRAMLEPLSYPPGTDSGVPSFKRDLVSKLAQLLLLHEDLIQKHQPGTLVRNRLGYYLRGVLSETHLNLPRMLVGSEGTLGIITEATLHTAPLPPNRVAMILLFGQLESATKAVHLLQPLLPSACDLLDRRLLTLARESDPNYENLIPASAEAALIVETDGFSPEQAAARLSDMLRAVRSGVETQFVVHEVHDAEDVDFLWTLPRRVVPLLTSLQGPTRALPFVEDVAIPPESLHELLVNAQRIFRKHRVITSLYAHAAAGQIHFRPFMESPMPETAMKMEELARDLYEVVYSLGGTIGGEHASGLSRSGFIEDQYGPLYGVFRQIKEIFDPYNLMNPGKVISDDPHLILKNLRPPTVVTPQATPELVELNLRWSPQQLSTEANRCNGCGACRTVSPDTRMCPVFRIDPLEDASPRAKANLIRGLSSGMLKEEDLSSPEMKSIANLCFNCKQCQLECPTNVNIPHLMIEAKAAYVAAHGLDKADWFLSRVHWMGSLAGRAPLFSNWVLGSGLPRWMLEKFAGIARHRKLPPFARQNFMKYAQREWLVRPVRRSDKPPVVYFVDHYANYHDPELGKALVAILRHHGIPVYVPQGQITSGMAMFSAGDIDAARKNAEKNLRELAELARDGMRIICTEPAAALCLKYEYPMFVDHPDVQVLADSVVEAGAFLRELRDENSLHMEFNPLRASLDYHTPCHLRALGQGTPFRELLDLIPKLKVNTIEKGCSGMAGAYGLTSANFRDSLRIGWKLVSHMKRTKAHAGVTECSSCKLQMEQGTEIPTVHPLKLLAWSYGLIPGLERILEPVPRRFTTT